jgi:tRNA(adenine34) deaminase
VRNPTAEVGSCSKVAGIEATTVHPVSDPSPEWDLLMLDALTQAIAAGDHGDVPIGAVAVHDGRVIAKAHNQREMTGDPTAHAEVLALRAAAEQLGSWRLDGVTLVVTLEPCPMCAGAAWASRIDRLVYGAPNLDAGATGSVYNLATDPRLNHEFEVIGGVRAEESARLLTDFFAERRA